MLTKATINRIQSITAIVVLLLIGFAIWGYTRSRDEQSPTAGQSPNIATISASDLAQRIIGHEEILVLDLRSKADFLSSHIPDAISMPTYELSLKQKELAVFKDWETILVCAEDTCDALTTAVRDLGLLGFTNLKRLEGGFTTYTEANYSLASQAKLIQDDLVDVLSSLEVPEISIETVQTADPEQYYLVDVRTALEFATGFIPGSINIPLNQLGSALEQGLLDQSAELVVYDRKGNRSPIAVQALLDAGFKKVHNLTGGIEAWKTQNFVLDLPAEDGSDLQTLMPLLSE